MIHPPPLSTSQAGSTKFALGPSSEQWARTWRGQVTARPGSIVARSSVWRPAVLPRSEALPGTLDRGGAQAVTATTGRMARDLQEFERRCDLLRQAFAIPGMSIAVVQAQELILARGFGIVDLAEGTPAGADTPYPVASLTKTFAAAVIMRLVEAGKLDLDEPMATYDPEHGHWCERIKDLPEARDYNCAAERITVRHHLTHTAQGKPGRAYAYNGVLFARLSAVVDTMSPRGFKRAVEEDILEPLGMRDTALGAGDPNKAAVIASMAKPYALNRDWTLTRPTVLRPPLDYFSAASGLISTVLDLAKYDLAIDRDQVYSPEAKRQVWDPARSPTGERFPYGLGWFVWQIPGPRADALALRLLSRCVVRLGA
jgi:CubicO group peptidase (beta-lactamase class C family)